MGDPPPLKIISRSSDATAIFTGPPKVGKAGELLSGSTSIVAFSSEGGWMCAVGSETVDLVSSHTMQQVRSLPISNILFVGFSPQATYLVTCQRPNKQQGGAHKNIQVWEVASGNLVWELHQKSVNEENWPAIQWNDQETLAFHMVTNTIHAYDPANGFQGVVRKLPLKGVAGFAISPGDDPKVAAYVAESKGHPGSVGIYPVANLPQDREREPEIVNRKGFFRVSGTKFMWNSTGTALLCMSFSDVDVTNQSYYGEQQLHYMDGAEMNACGVPNLPKGPIHEVQWSPKGDFFAVVAGFMPAKTLLFNAQCKPVFDLGTGPHNFIRWNPQGRFLCVAGFGNLPGDIVFYEKKANGSCRKMAATRCPSVSLEWSPDGRHVLTAITAPRLRVDNGFRVFTYYGEEVHGEVFKELYEASWVPSAPGVYPDRPPSPGRQGTVQNSMAASLSSQPSAYVPPHMRGKSVRPSAPTFSLGHSTDQGGKIRDGTASQEPVVPGAAFVSKSAAKNAKRRAKKRAAKEAGEGGGEEAPPPTTPPQTQKSSSNVEELVQGMSSLGQPGDPPPPKNDEREKRVRNLKKKLRQIQQLKEKRDTEGESALEKEQIAKIQTEESIREELNSLGVAV